MEGKRRKGKENRDRIGRGRRKYKIDGWKEGRDKIQGREKR